MDGKKLVERLRFDMKFLLWRAEVHTLPAHEVDQRFREISLEYQTLALDSQQELIQHQLADWRVVLDAQERESVSY